MLENHAVNDIMLENHAVNDIMLENVVEPDRPRMTIWRMRVAC